MLANLFKHNLLKQREPTEMEEENDNLFEIEEENDNLLDNSIITLEEEIEKSKKRFIQSEKRIDKLKEELIYWKKVAKNIETSDTFLKELNSGLIKKNSHNFMKPACADNFDKSTSSKYKR